MPEVTRDVAIRVDLKGATRAAQETKKVETSMQRLSRIATKLHSSFSAIGGALKGLAFKMAATAGAGALLGRQMIKAGGDLTNLQEGFRNLVAAKGDEDPAVFFKKVKTALKGTLSEAETLTLVNQALVFGVGETSDEMAKMAEVSRRLAKTQGTDLRFAFESLILGTARMERRIIDNIGLNVRANDAYKAFAQSVGKSITELNAQEKQLAFNNAVMKAADRALKELPPDTDSAAETFRQFTSVLSDLFAKTSQVILASEAFPKILHLIGRAAVFAVENLKPLVNLVGTLAGAFAGSAAGGRIGSVIPGVGTAIGSLAGGVIGAAAGRIGIGKLTTPLPQESFDRLAAEIRDAFDDVISNVEDARRDMASKLRTLDIRIANQFG